MSAQGFRRGANRVRKVCVYGSIMVFHEPNLALLAEYVVSNECTVISLCFAKEFALLGGKT